MKILIIEDDAEFSRQIRTYLEGEEYRCEQADTYESALDKLSFYQYDCILLNPMLPGGDGIRLLTYLRERQLSAGLIVISTEDLLDDKILWLRIGADDYMARPFHLSELSARIYSIIRRRQFQNNNMIAFKEMKMDLLAKSLYVRDKPVTLTKKE
ncbi:MAG: response regulator transcription factor, partial [Bacteroidota bacterium]